MFTKFGMGARLFKFEQLYLTYNFFLLMSDKQLQVNVVYSKLYRFDKISAVTVKGCLV